MSEPVWQNYRYIVSNFVLDLTRWTIRMKTQAGEIEVDASPNDMIQRLKDAVQTSQGIPMQQYQLVFHNKLLDNNQNLIQNGIKSGDVINLVPLQTGTIFICSEKHLIGFN